MSFWRRMKDDYPTEQLELHKTALEMKGIAINLQRTVEDLNKLVEELRTHKSEPSINPGLVNQGKMKNEYNE